MVLKEFSCTSMSGNDGLGLEFGKRGLESPRIMGGRHIPNASQKQTEHMSKKLQDKARARREARRTQERCRS